MTTMFRKAERQKARLRLGLFGPAGSGKTYSALRVAKGLGGKIALIDTEAGSGELYSKQFDYDVCQLAAPFTPEKYVEAMKAAEGAGYDTIVVDSLSHAWAGAGGILDIQGKAADKSRNSYTAWREATPRHNELVEAILQSKCHVIITMRSKTEYVLEEDERGKKVPKKVGMAPVQRDGMEYEMTVCAEIDERHEARFSKDRTSMFSKADWSPLTEATGAKLRAWLEDGVEIPALAPAAAPPKAAKKATTATTASPFDELAAEKMNVSEFMKSLADRLNVNQGDKAAYEMFAKSQAAAALEGRTPRPDSLEDWKALRKHLEGRLTERPAEPEPEPPQGAETSTHAVTGEPIPC